MWSKAVDRAGRVFGVTGLPLASAQNMARLGQEVHKVASEYRESSENYLSKLEAVLRSCALLESNPPRLETARSVRVIVAEIDATKKPIEVVRRLQTMATATSEKAMGISLKQASGMLGALQGLNVSLPVFDGLRQLTDEPRATAARGLIEKLHEALCADEYVIPLSSVLSSLQQRAGELISVRPPLPPDPGPTKPPVDLPPLPPLPKKRKVVSHDSGVAKGLRECQAVLRNIESHLDETSELRFTWEIVREETE